MIYLLTAIGQPPGGSSRVHIYTQKEYTERHNTNNTQNNTIIHRTIKKIIEQHKNTENNTKTHGKTKKYIEQNKQYIEQHKNTQNNTTNNKTTQKYIEQHKNTQNNTKIHRTTQKFIEQRKKYIEQHKNQEECGPCPVFVGFTLAFALQLRKKHGKT